MAKSQLLHLSPCTLRRNHLEQTKSPQDVSIIASTFTFESVVIVYTQKRSVLVLNACQLVIEVELINLHLHTFLKHFTVPRNLAELSG